MIKPILMISDFEYSSRKLLCNCKFLHIQWSEKTTFFKNAKTVRFQKFISMCFYDLEYQMVSKKN